jgi:hypothetical protein
MLVHITEGIIPGIRWLRDAPALPPNRKMTMRCYFNIRDGETSLDEEGLELRDMEAVKDEAVQATADLVKGMKGSAFWSGETWKMWVTDKPKGAGNTLLTLTFKAELSATYSFATSPLPSVGEVAT